MVGCRRKQRVREQPPVKPAGHTGLGDLQLVEGWVINPAWFSPGEGPFTVAAKIISANVASLSQMLSKLQVSRANSIQTRSFVCADWLIASPSPIAKILAARCFAFPQFRCAADDHAFRYCTICLNRGYQSATCQISGLRAKLNMRICPSQRL